MFYEAADRARSLPFVNRLIRRIKPVLKHANRAPIRILFVIHDYSYMRNFDDCIRRFLRSGHKVTFVLPRQEDDRIPKKFQRLDPDIGVRCVSRTRGDQWRGLAAFVRGARNYLLYRKSTFVKATYLQHRATRETPENVKSFLEQEWIRRWPRAADVFFRILEAGIPAASQARRLIIELQPDIVLISPYFTTSTRYQVEYAKAARELGVPVGVPVFSWDNLSSKGAMQVRPDRLFVWNKTQVEEAATLHGIPASRVVITGGMRFAKFISKTPTLSNEKFCKSYGLDPSAILVTYLGSSRTIAPKEHEFLWRWIEAMRSAKDPRLRSCNIFVRPHPGNTAIWDHWPQTAPPGVAVWDGTGNNVRGVINAVGNSAAVVGINTTAMLEAAALGKPILTVLDDDLRGGQVERIHFHYLTSVAGGLLTVANDLEEHVGHLTAILNGDPSFSRKSKKFSKAFLLPPWPQSSPVKAFNKAVTQLARRPGPIVVGRTFLPRILLRPVAAYFARQLGIKSKTIGDKDFAI